MLQLDPVGTFAWNIAPLNVVAITLSCVAATPQIVALIALIVVPPPRKTETNPTSIMRSEVAGLVKVTDTVQVAEKILSTAWALSKV